MCGRYYVDQEDDLSEIRKILTELNKKFQGQQILDEMRTGEIFPTHVAPVLQAAQREAGQSVSEPILEIAPASMSPGVSSGLLDDDHHEPPETHQDRKNQNKIIVPGLMRWGFERPHGSGVVINARAETAAEKPFFRQAFQYGRILVPASAFFEWRKLETEENLPGQNKDDAQLTLDSLQRQKDGAGWSAERPLPDSGLDQEDPDRKMTRSEGTLGRPVRRSASRRTAKQKVKLSLPDEPAFYMAGLSRPANDRAGSRFVILTTAATPSVAAIHDRQPLILPRRWLRSWLLDDTFVREMLSYVLEKKLQLQDV